MSAKKSTTSQGGSGHRSGTTPLERLMHRFGVPVTRESYLALDHAGQPPSELSAEQEMDLPERLRHKHPGHRG
jgi:hypothetical protein